MKIKHLAKNMTLVILFTGFAVGCVGAFIKSFDMEGYATFLRGYAPWFIALIGSIGVNSAVGKVKGGDK